MALIVVDSNVFDVAPSINSTPSPSFTQGQSSSYDMTQHVSDDGFSAVTYSLSNTLPNGLSFNASTGVLDYDGLGADTTSQHALTATDAVGSDTSATFNITISEAFAGQEDWQERISQPGVVWYHGFETESEVTRFRVSSGVGHDPAGTGDPTDTMSWQASGGPDGFPYMKNARTAGTSDVAQWRRPFSPFTGATNGKGADDPGASGSIDAIPYTFSQGGNEINTDVDTGWYVHPDNVNSFSDGTDFWLQVRVKVDHRRMAAGNFQGGKRVWFNVTQSTNPRQEIVNVAANGNYSGDGSSELNTPQAYIDNGPAMSPIATPGQLAPPYNNSIQNGSDNPLICHPYNDLDVSGCWSHATDGTWDTLLYHVTPGHANTSDTRYEMWGMHEGENEYTKYEDVVYPSPFTTGDYFGNEYWPGWNCMILSSYSNGFAGVPLSAFDENYAQVILSQDYIQPPRATTTALQDECRALSAGQSQDLTPNPLQKDFDIQWQVVNIYYDPVRREIQYMGKPASGQPNPEYSHYIYDESTNTWSTSGQSLFQGTGHVYGETTFDPTTGDYWLHRYNQNFLSKYDRATSTWTQTSSPSPSLTGNITLASIGWHPNLFGMGVPGILCWSALYFHAYNPATDTWSTISTQFSTSSAYWNRFSGASVYLRKTDQLLCWSGDENGHPMVVIDAGAGLQADAIASGHINTSTTPPVEITGSGVANSGKVMIHPSVVGRLILVEEHGTSRVWTSDDAGVTWDSAGTHPFQSMSSGEYITGVGPYGVILAMSSDGSGGEYKIWKPNS